MNRIMRHPLFTWSMALALLPICRHAVGAPPASPEQPVGTAFYESSSYSTSAHVEAWSRKTVDRTAQKMLGPFANDRQTLTLKAVPGHEFLRVKVELVIVGDWQGNAKAGPDRIVVSLGDGRTLLDASFASPTPDETVARRQSYPDNLESGSFPPQTGLTMENVPWAPPGNAVYSLDFVFPHSAPEVRVDFQGQVRVAKPDNRQWGVGRVQVFLMDKAPVQLDRQAVRGRVEDLRANDPMAAQRAIRELVSAGDSVVDPIREWFSEQSAAIEGRAEPLIAQLDDAAYAKREAAENALLEMGIVVVPVCKKAMAGATSEEVKARLNDIIERVSGGVMTPWESRLGRVLDLLGTPKAMAFHENFRKVPALPTLEGIRSRFGTITDAEWNVLGPRIQGALDAVQNQASMKTRRAMLSTTTEMRTLQRLVHGGAVTPDAELKLGLATLRNSHALNLNEPQYRELKLARDRLLPLLTIRQEAILVALGVLD